MDISRPKYAGAFNWAQLCTTDLETPKRRKRTGKGIKTDYNVLAPLSHEERCRQLWAAVLNQALEDTHEPAIWKARNRSDGISSNQKEREMAHDDAQRFAFSEDGAWARSRNEILAILDIPTSSYQATARAVHNGAIDLRYGA